MDKICYDVLMVPSSTVENYLKAIYMAQSASGDHQELVPMGRLASALGVVPGTATTMVKTLADSGLVHYEPYAGVRLTPAGERLAGRVLRRHRLIELFLVKVTGMSWAEVHEEAEQLEHAVSDRLIERIDDMLGHPSTDPHGDPIPDAEGTVSGQQYETLLTCPLHTPVVVTRVTDQDAAFLRFIESSDLKPGEPIEIEARDTESDSVSVKRHDRRITIGMRAASKVLVKSTKAILLVVLGAAMAWAQAQGSSRPFEIMDNSFLVEVTEHGYEHGIVRHAKEIASLHSQFTPSEERQLVRQFPITASRGSRVHWMGNPPITGVPF